MDWVSSMNSGELMRVAGPERSPTARCVSERRQKTSRRLRNDLAHETRFAPQKVSRMGRGKYPACSVVHLNGPLMKSLRLSTGLLLHRAIGECARALFPARRSRGFDSRFIGSFTVVRACASHQINHNSKRKTCVKNFILVGKNPRLRKRFLIGHVKNTSDTRTHVQ
jgi:hypothetical protein